MSRVERATQVLQTMQLAQDLRLAVLRKRNPGLTEQELLALWTEERYRDELPADFLARACEAIRNYRPAAAER